ncbi:hypothetical protein FLX35_05435 [Cylindrospermopsis raciborskii LB2897]|nr:hypothetical protein [Cylindrospermopsis raciborskii LB2897]
MDYEFILLISGFVDTYLDLSPLEEIEFEEEIRKFSQPIQEGVMQITTSWTRCCPGWVYRIHPPVPQRALQIVGMHQR